MPGNRYQPWPKRPIRLEPSKGATGAKEHFTHGILGRLRIAEHPPTDAAYVSAVLAKQRGERLAIAGKRTFDDRPGRLVIHSEAVSPMPLPPEDIDSFLEACADPRCQREAASPIQLAAYNRKIQLDDIPRVTIGAVSLPRRLLTLQYEREARNLRHRLVYLTPTPPSAGERDGARCPLDVGCGTGSLALEQQDPANSLASRGNGS